MQQAGWWKRVQRHELQQLHGREERPPSSQHDHQREKGHRPRRYFGNQAAGWHLCPRFSGLGVGGQASPSGRLDLYLVPSSLWKCLLRKVQLSFKIVSHVPPASSNRSQRTLSPTAWYHRMRPAKRAEARPSEFKRSPRNSQRACPHLEGEGWL